MLLLIEIVSMLVRNIPGSLVGIYRVSQELSSLLRFLIPELILSQKVIYTWVQLATVQEL